MSEHADSQQPRTDGLRHTTPPATGFSGSSGITVLSRLLPVAEEKRRMMLWAVLHGLAAILAGALLWRMLPAHLLTPWLMFMLLSAGLFLLQGSSRQRIAGDDLQPTTVWTFMALTFGLAWGGGAIAAAAFMDTLPRLLTVLALAPLGALTTPLLRSSDLAPRLYVVLLAIPGAILVAMTPEPGLFAAAFTTAAAVVAVLGVLATTQRHDGRQRTALDPYTGDQRVISDAPGDGGGALSQTLTQPHQTLLSAQQQRDRTHATLQSLNEAVITMDTAGRIDYLNPAAEVLTGWAAADAMGRSGTELISLTSRGAETPAVSPIEQSLLTERTVLGDHDTTLVRRDGSRCEIEFTCSPIRDSAGRFNGLVLSMRDVSDTRDMQAKLSWAATHDPLTGLINRREFEARLQKLHTGAAQDGSQHALCFIDLDHFKSLNDTCGHLAGDDFLKGLAETLRGRIRGADTVARLGGDEFAVLLYGCPLDMAERIAENLRRAISDFCGAWRDQNPLLGASIGVVPVTGDSKSLIDILATADLACYAAKSEGRNRVNVFRGNQDMLERWQGEVRWLQSIQTALEENRFVLHWQPIAPLSAEDRTQMCELFVHLRDTDDEVYAPADFMPTAQRYHLLPAIDFWVASMVVNALRTWHPTLSPMECIGLNLSTQSVTDERFENELLDMLADPAIPAYKLCFQVSEAAFMSHPARVRHFTERLKARGCKLAVDDCGVGAGSFNHLRRHEVDYVKIHDEFTRELAGSALDREVVLSLYRIARCMGARTIAERVADTAVLEQLRTLGIDYAQGFAVSRPQPLELASGAPVSAGAVA